MAVLHGFCSRMITHSLAMCSYIVPTGTCYVAYQLTPIFVTIYYKLKLDCGKSLF